MSTKFPKVSKTTRIAIFSFIAIAAFYLYTNRIFVSSGNAVPKEFSNISQFSIEGYSKYVRYFDFALLIILLLATIWVLLHFARLVWENFRSAVTSWPFLGIAATGSMLLLYSFTYIDTLGGTLWATHESEWLSYSITSCDRFIHGWLINCFPSELWSLAPDGRQIMFGRLVRFSLGAIAYLLAPLILLLALKADAWSAPVGSFADSSRGAGSSAARQKASFVAACVAVLFLPAGYLSFGDPHYSIAHIPVRDISLNLILIGALGAIAAQNSDSTFKRRLLAWSLFGSLSAFGFLVNILAPAQAIVVLAAPLAHLFASPEGRTPKSLSYPAAFGAAWLMTLLIIWLLAPGAVQGSIDSLLFFTKYGPFIFADQYLPDNPGLSLRTTLAMMVLASCTIIILRSVRSQAHLFRFDAGLLALSLGNFINIFLITGTVTSTAGALLCLAYLAGRIVWRLSQELGVPQISSVPRRAEISNLAFALLAPIVVLAVGGGFTVVRQFVGYWRTPDSIYVSTETQAYVAAGKGGASCYFSLLSEDSLAAVSHVPLCSHSGMPWYNAGLSDQAKLIGELALKKPDVVHVASLHPDNPYAPERHLHNLARWVYAHYCPASLVDGRWFWSQSTSGCKVPAELVTTAAMEIPIESYGQLTVSLPAQTAGGTVGIMLVDALQGQTLAAVVGSPGTVGTDDKVNFSISPTPDMTNKKLRVLLFENGKPIRQINTIALEDKRVH